ncbi:MULTISPECIES: hypothetical protein [Streptomyces]|uniref:hypothetical protein n=1 Tax=Streptomyces TaxID=1883 RepID=UPI000A54D9C2|nr:hypothetical protein [Streptomyces sp. CB00316]
MDSNPTRGDYLAAAREELDAGNPGLASLLAEEADHRANTPAENATVARDFPGGLRRKG